MSGQPVTRPEHGQLELRNFRTTLDFELTFQSSGLFKTKVVECLHHE
jgi:hypothetical protein